MDLKKLLRTQWDRSAAIGSVAVGAILLIAGWFGVSGTAYLAEQTPYVVSGGIGGVFLLGLGASLWISADLRDEWRKLDRIERALGDGTLRWADDEPLVPRQRGGTLQAPALTVATQVDPAVDVVPDVVVTPPAPPRKAAAARSARPTTTARTTRAAAPRTTRTSRAARTVSTDA